MTEKLSERLLEHADIHARTSSVYDDEQAKWERDLRVAAQLVRAVELTLDEIQEHPMFMGYDASDDEIDSEGGDAAFVTVIGIRLNEALAEGAT